MRPIAVLLALCLSSAIGTCVTAAPASTPLRLAQAAPPAPAPGAAPPATQDSSPAPSTPADRSEPVTGENRVQTGANGLPEVFYGDSLLPEPVRKTRDSILEAAASGDIERLRALVEGSDVSVGEGDNDPVDFLKSQSGDPEGREVLAILTEILQAGYTRVDVGTPDEMYVWPYFTYYPLDKLSPPQMVELFKIITGQDFADMKEYGAYVFFRVGISPDGVWHFFISGD